MFQFNVENKLYNINNLICLSSSSCLSLLFVFHLLQNATQSFIWKDRSSIYALLVSVFHNAFTHNFILTAVLTVRMDIHEVSSISLNDVIQCEIVDAVIDQYDTGYIKKERCGED